MKQQYWAVSDYDGVLVMEAPDDVTAIGLLAKLAKSGNVRTQTLELESGDMKQILARRNSAPPAGIFFGMGTDFNG